MNVRCKDDFNFCESLIIITNYFKKKILNLFEDGRTTLVGMNEEDWITSLGGGFAYEWRKDVCNSFESIGGECGCLDVGLVNKV